MSQRLWCSHCPPLGIWPQADLSSALQGCWILHASLLCAGAGSTIVGRAGEDAATAFDTTRSLCSAVYSVSRPAEGILETEALLFKKHTLKYSGFVRPHLEIEFLKKAFGSRHSGNEVQDTGLTSVTPLTCQVWALLEGVSCQRLTSLISW